jgi:hypothetical protein
MEAQKEIDVSKKQLQERQEDMQVLNEQCFILEAQRNQVLTT